VVFKKFGIPVYLVWDSDSNAKKDLEDHKRRNRYLLRLLGFSEQDYPSGVVSTHACFDGDLSSVLKQEIGEKVLQDSLASFKTEFGMDTDQALKNPVFYELLLDNTHKAQRTSPTLEEIVDKVVLLLGAKLTPQLAQQSGVAANIPSFAQPVF
jgi:hypothetical protein